MKSKAIILVLVILLLISQAGYSQILLTFNPFQTYRFTVTGNEYLELSENEKMPYVVGLFDMFNLMMGAHFPDIYKLILEATKDIPLTQIRKIFEKYLEDNPENLHFSAANLFGTAILEMIGGNNEK